MRLTIAASFVVAIAPHHFAIAFSPVGTTTRTLNPQTNPLLVDTIIPQLRPQTFTHGTLLSRIYAADNDSSPDSSPNKDENPYADPNYPELEFVNYDDPEYQVDQGVGDEDYFLTREQDNERTLAEIEAMREERRRKNDEFQFETYHAEVLRGGEISLGEWTVFQTDTFMGEDVSKGRHPEALHVPRLLKWDKTLKVVSRGSKIILDPDAPWRVDGERIVHEERLATADDIPAMMDDGDEKELEWDEVDRIHVSGTFWPNEMTSLDFRGDGGNMCVGKAYTICDAMPLLGQKQSDSEDERHEGPFSEMRTELGIQENEIRFRIKLDYGLLEDESSFDESSLSSPPSLHLRTLTICRETLDGYWPRPSDNGDSQEEDGESAVRRRNQDEIEMALFGPPGAQGGLYDSPPVGSEKRAIENYMLLQFEGGATALLPHRLDQHNSDDDANTGDSFGWVTSLDWTPGSIRYQVDRKVLSGAKIKGLRTLELSEVRSDDADRWRPRDGGTNMRQ